MREELGGGMGGKGESLEVWEETVRDAKLTGLERAI